MYQLTRTSSIVRLSDSASIPADPANRDYAEYLNWKAKGGVPLPLPAPAFDRGAASARLKAVRKPILDALAGIAGRLQRKGDTASAAAADTAAQGLLDMPTFPAIFAASDDASFDAACVARYKELAAACPVNVRSAFKEAV